MATQAGAEQVSAIMIRDYAEGRLSWSRLRETTGVEDFGVILRRLGEEGLKLPRASRERPTQARLWLREALARVVDPA
jgi:hypothetical protein